MAAARQVHSVARRARPDIGRSPPRYVLRSGAKKRDPSRLPGGVFRAPFRGARRAGSEVSPPRAPACWPSAATRASS